MKSKNSTGCPTEEILSGYTDGTLRERRDDIEAHLATCERCFSLVAELIASARQMSGAVLVTPPIGLEREVQGKGLTEESPGWAASLIQRVAEALFTYRAAGAVAMVSIVALAIIWVGQRDHRPSEDPATVRSAGTVTEAPILIEPAGEIVAQDSLRFRWEPWLEGAHYVLVVVNTDVGAVAVQAAVPSDGYAVSTDDLLESGGRHFEWTVECTLSDGRLLLAPVVRFQLVRSSPDE